MAVAPEMLKVLRLVNQDKVYWSRLGNSREYDENEGQLKAAIRAGFVIVMETGCCRKEYVLSTTGEEALLC